MERDSQAWLNSVTSRRIVRTSIHKQRLTFGRRLTERTTFLRCSKSLRQTHLSTFGVNAHLSEYLQSLRRRRAGEPRALFLAGGLNNLR